MTTCHDQITDGHRSAVTDFKDSVSKPVGERDVESAVNHASAAIDGRAVAL
jgi:hypothetical protein